MLGSGVRRWRLTFNSLLKVQFSCENIFPFLPNSAKLIGDFFSNDNRQCTSNCSLCFLYFVHCDIEGGRDGVEDGDGGGDEHEERSGDGERSARRRSQPTIEEGRQKKNELKMGIQAQIYWRNNAPYNKRRCRLNLLRV